MGISSLVSEEHHFRNFGHLKGVSTGHGGAGALKTFASLFMSFKIQLPNTWNSYSDRWGAEW